MDNGWHWMTILINLTSVVALLWWKDRTLLPPRGVSAGARNTLNWSWLRGSHRLIARLPPPPGMLPPHQRRNCYLVFDRVVGKYSGNTWVLTPTSIHWRAATATQSGVVYIWRGGEWWRRPTATPVSSWAHSHTTFSPCIEKSKISPFSNSAPLVWYFQQQQQCETGTLFHIHPLLLYL